MYHESRQLNTLGSPRKATPSMMCTIPPLASWKHQVYRGCLFLEDLEVEVFQEK